MNKIRAVAYIRVSTEKDAQLHSYEFQEQYWEKAFDGDPSTELVRIYADKGISGHSVRKRPQFLLMMQDARDHKFDKIYTKSVSRFARNTTQLLEAVRELRDCGIEVIFENENIHTFQPTSEIFLTIAAAIAENDLDGVSIASTYKRVYNDSKYLSGVTGYISLVSAEEMAKAYGEAWVGRAVPGEPTAANKTTEAMQA